MNTYLIERLESAGRLERNYIGGEWVLSGGQARSAVIDPSTEEPVAEIALGTAVPFGGYKRSGNGREYGVEGLEEYLETKAVLGYLEGTAPGAA
jgi:acyl-CoA reductase-like NAD-dependent aldehyde dehydrogenase